eukprot:CAMPEP_0119293234 /NCGR_PEP_ID=MMETSP1329-20130426/45669_1 /TAXON_ID=114041 /ORGANISM="Genus nov. species nov., Strain RCC1024" /LENGTH=138 /DNA_ID=CAMNT_0007294097 /DNA_START=134 /DNA_END=546 /DNA_ORIENTATION=+
MSSTALSSPPSLNSPSRAKLDRLRRPARLRASAESLASTESLPPAYDDALGPPVDSIDELDALAGDVLSRCDALLGTSATADPVAAAEALRLPAAATNHVSNLGALVAQAQRDSVELEALLGRALPADDVVAGADAAG